MISTTVSFLTCTDDKYYSDKLECSEELVDLVKVRWVLCCLLILWFFCTMPNYDHLSWLLLIIFLPFDVDYG